MSFCQDKKQTQRDKRLALRRWIVGTSCRMVIVGMVIVFGILYVLETSSLSTKGFIISELQSNITTLEQETRALNVEIATHRSMSSIQERLAHMDLVQAGTPEYINAVGSAVARR